MGAIPKCHVRESGFYLQKGECHNSNGCWLVEKHSLRTSFVFWTSSELIKPRVRVQNVNKRQALKCNQISSNTKAGQGINERPCDCMRVYSFLNQESSLQGQTRFFRISGRNGRESKLDLAASGTRLANRDNSLLLVFLELPIIRWSPWIHCLVVKRMH
jgi:hypothetical protein